MADTVGFIYHFSSDPQLVFKCPHCKKNHCIHIDADSYQEEAGRQTWKFEIEEDTNIMELQPSFNASNYCGWHSKFNWTVELVKLSELTIKA